MHPLPQVVTLSDYTRDLVSGPRGDAGGESGRETFVRAEAPLATSTRTVTTEATCYSEFFATMDVPVSPSTKKAKEKLRRTQRRCSIEKRRASWRRQRCLAQGDT